MNGSIGDESRVQTEALVWNSRVGAFESAKNAPTSPRFLKGPVPWHWISRAAALDGRALEVGLCLWRLFGATKSKTVRLSNHEVAALGVDRHAKSRALKALAKAGLVQISFARGKSVEVTILV